MNFFSPELQKYSESHTTPESTILKRLDRDTHLKALYPRMISGHFHGRVLSMLTHMIKPKRVLEIGTFTGYSAICLAEGLPPDGEIITIDKNRELEDMVREYLENAGMAKQVKYLLGDAMEVIPTLQETFDLVFLDADKENYSNYFNLIIDKVPSGGYILADNVLWYGKVLENKSQKNDRETQAIIDFNRLVHNDPRVENVLMPIRDGLMILRKI